MLHSKYRLFLACGLLLNLGCSHSSPASGKENPIHSASPTPHFIANGPIKIVYAERGMKERQFSFNAEIQWIAPDSWERLNLGGWQTPDGIIVKLLIPEERPVQLTAERAAALAAQGGDLSAVKFDPPPAPVTQGELRLLMVAGKGQEGLGERRAVDWHACLIVPLHPEAQYGHGFIVAIGPRGTGTKARQALLEIAETIEVSKNGASPPKLVIRRN